MKFKLFITIFLFIFCFWGYSQNITVKNDTLKANLLKEEISNSLDKLEDGTDDGKRVKFYVQLEFIKERLSKTSNFKIKKYYQDLFILLKYYKAVELSCNGNYSESIKKFNEILIYYKTFEGDYLYDKIYYYVGINYYYLNKDKEAIMSYEKAIVYAIKYHNKQIEADAYNNIGSTYARINIYEKSIDCYYKSLLIDEYKQNEDVLIVYLNIIKSYIELQEFEKINIIFEKTKKILHKKNISNTLQMLLYHFMANAMYKTNNMQKANEYVKIALTLSKKEGSSVEKANLFSTYGSMLLKEKKYSEALKNYQLSYNVYKKDGHKSNESVILYKIANYFLVLDSIQSITKSRIEVDTLFSKKNSYAKNAKYYFQKSLDIGYNSDNFLNKKNTYCGLKKVYLREKNYSKAFEMLELETKMKNIITQKNNKNLFLESEIRYEYEKKHETDSLKFANERKINIAKIEKTKAEKKVLYIGIFAMSLLLIIGYSRFKYIKKKKLIEIEKKNLQLQINQKEIISTELAFLKAQINPHFLFNVINSIYFKIDKTNDVARNAVLGFSELLRYQLYECNYEFVPIEKEIHFIKEYIQLQLLRKQKNIYYTDTIDENLVGFSITPFLLIPFIENAFKYLSDDKDKTNSLNLKITKNENLFTFEVSNDFNKETSINTEIKNSGIGILNIKRRLNLLYPNKHNLVIIPTESNYKVTLTLNVN